MAPEGDLNGKWAIQQADKSLINVGGRPEKNAQEVANRRGQVAILKQEGNKLTGVFMTSVGDSRELEGTIQGNRFYLSHFSGPSPRLIKGTIDESRIDLIGCSCYQPQMVQVAPSRSVAALGQARVT